MALVIGAYLLRRAGYISPEQVMGFLQAHSTLAPVLFIALYAVLPSLMLPTLPLAIGAGFLWGPL